MSDKIFISEGYYRGDDDNEYMSIWTFKRKFGVLNNTNEQNYEDAKEITCSDKERKPFNESDKFKSGWVYNVQSLKEFYGINS